MTEEKTATGEEATKAQEDLAGKEAEAEPETPAMPEEGEKDADGNHMLEYKWTLWFDSHTKGQSQTNYGESRKKVFTFSTVEDFWRLYNNIKMPSDFQPNTDYCLFKEGIEPEWEDARNEKGGCWTVQTQRQDSKDADDFWMTASMAMVGEAFEEGEEICGLFCSIRNRGNRIQVWTRNADNEDAQKSIGKQLKDVMNIKEDGRLAFSAHTDSKKGPRHPKERYVI
ncbi:hypothetical protein BSKO_01958 [Bryopsis sp. KO-2023]|nr:hypothetical protein BSKO_01958 [Bryopsis sp. KO-2023]